MIISMISYNVDPTALTVGLGALLAALIMAVVLSAGLLFLKYKADKNRMSQDTYVYIKRIKAIKEEIKKEKENKTIQDKQKKQSRQKSKKKKKFEIVYKDDSINNEVKVPDDIDINEK